MPPPEPQLPTELTLRIVRVVAPTAVVAMTVAVVLGFVGAEEGAAAALFDNAWGRATIVDLYLALGALLVWIAWRERHAGRTVLWAVLLVVTGSIAAWVYVALAARRARSFAELLLGPVDVTTPERGPA